MDVRLDGTPENKLDHTGRRPVVVSKELVVIDHFGINCADLEKSKAFYDSVLGVLGHSRLMDFGVAVGYGTSQPQFWIATFEGAGPNREMHIAFTAPDAAAVRAVHSAALAAGAESLHEPRIWPEYHPNYYGAFFRDPDGNNVEAVCHTADPAVEGLAVEGTIGG